MTETLKESAIIIWPQAKCMGRNRAVWQKMSVPRLSQGSGINYSK